MKSSSGQRPTSFLCFALGLLALVVAVVIHPAVGAHYREHIVNFSDVMLRASRIALALGASLLILGVALGRRGFRRWTTAALLYCSVAAVVLIDSLVLAAVGLPYWIVDPVLHYRHRPNTVRDWSDGMSLFDDPRYRGKTLHLNRFGYHDENFDRAKPAGQLRGLFIGDSITMGQGVNIEETFSAQLERLLAAHGADQTRYRTYQMINTGVQGYTTSQERRVLKEALDFDPDFVAIGFCMNDITMPFATARGPTAAPHGLISLLAGASGSNLFLRWLQNETGLGRLVQKWRQHRARLEKDPWKIDIRDMASAPPGDPRYRASWQIAFDDLAAMYGLAQQRGLAVVLLIFPDAFQLFNPAVQHPQAALVEHARGLGVPAIDFTPVFEEEILAYIALRRLDAGQAAVEDLAVIVQNLYFLDYQHLTVHGHRVVAATLAEFIHRQEVVRLELNRLRRARRAWLKAASDYHITVPNRSYDLVRLIRALRGLGETGEMAKVCRDGLSFFQDSEEDLAPLMEACR